jgi:phosphopantothenoylcysteine synthetase/decarboxylase
VKRRKSVVLGVTGSIAAYKACDIAGLLVKEGFGVHVVMTAEALEFVTPLTFQTISRDRVTTDMFAPPDEWNPRHTALAEKADLILIAPATANIIAKLACGICDDILTCTVYASKAPVLMAPAMNEKMYKHPVTQGNIDKLKKIGYRFIGPVRGMLACGYEEIGHIAGVKEIVDQAKRLLA